LSSFDLICYEYANEQSTVLYRATHSTNSPYAIKYAKNHELALNRDSPTSQRSYVDLLENNVSGLTTTTTIIIIIIIIIIMTRQFVRLRFAAGVSARML